MIDKKADAEKVDNDINGTSAIQDEATIDHYRRI